MTLTLAQPVPGRIGPGTLWLVSDDLVGPHVPGTQMFSIIQRASDHLAIMGNQGPVNSHTMSGFWGVSQNYYTMSGGGFGLLDNTDVEVRMFWLVPGSGIVNDTTWTGFQWDAVSTLWFALHLNFQFFFSGMGNLETNSDEILAAVKRTYSSP